MYGTEFGLLGVTVRGSIRKGYQLHISWDNSTMLPACWRRVFCMMIFRSHGYRNLESLIMIPARHNWKAMFLSIEGYVVLCEFKVLKSRLDLCSDHRFPGAYPRYRHGTADVRRSTLRFQLHLFNAKSAQLLLLQCSLLLQLSQIQVSRFQIIVH
jgi:hypothetical protein